MNRFAKLTIVLILAAAVLGQPNHFYGAGNVATRGADNIAKGHNNRFDGYRNNAQGNANSFKGNDNTARGNQNDVEGD